MRTYLKGVNMRNPFSKDKRIKDVYDWLEFGMKKGWCGPMVCSTHDGVPMLAEEEDEFGEGGDPCVNVIRPYFSDEERLDIEDSHAPSVWRKQYYQS
jgi:hypothetical protein